MDLKRQLLAPDFQARIKEISYHIGSDKTRFAALMELFFSNDLRTCQYASGVVMKCVDADISLIDPYLERMVKNLSNPVHDAVTRNTVRILQFVDIPESLWEDCLNYCFQYLEDRSTPVAIRVFSMTVLFNLSKKIPEIRNELALLIEDLLPYSSAGIQSRGKKILRRLTS